MSAVKIVFLFFAGCADFVGQENRRAARGVQLCGMMFFNNLHVEFFFQYRSDRRNRFRQRVDADGHIRGAEDRDFFGSLI